MCNAQSLERYVWSELTTSLFMGLDTDLGWVIIQALIFQDWHCWYFLILIPTSGFLVWLQFCRVGVRCTNSFCFAMSFLGKLIDLDLQFPLLEGGRRLFELKTKAQIAIWNLNRAGSVPSESQFSLFYPVLLLHTTRGGIFCWWGGKFPVGLQSLWLFLRRGKGEGRTHPPLPKDLQFISWAFLQCVGEKLSARILTRNGLFNKRSAHLFIYLQILLVCN